MRCPLAWLRLMVLIVLLPWGAAAQDAEETENEDAPAVQVDAPPGVTVAAPAIGAGRIKGLITDRFPEAPQEFVRLVEERSPPAELRGDSSATTETGASGATKGQTEGAVEAARKKAAQEEAWAQVDAWLERRRKETGVRSPEGDAKLLDPPDAPALHPWGPKRLSPEQEIAFLRALQAVIERTDTESNEAPPMNTNSGEGLVVKGLPATSGAEIAEEARQLAPALSLGSGGISFSRGSIDQELLLKMLGDRLGEARRLILESILRNAFAKNEIPIALQDFAQEVVGQLQPGVSVEAASRTIGLASGRLAMSYLVAEAVLRPRLGKSLKWWGLDPKEESPSLGAHLTRLGYGPGSADDKNWVDPCKGRPLGCLAPKDIDGTNRKASMASVLLDLAWLGIAAQPELADLLDFPEVDYATGDETGVFLASDWTKARRPEVLVAFNQSMVDDETEDNEESEVDKATYVRRFRKMSSGIAGRLGFLAVLVSPDLGVERIDIASLNALLPPKVRLPEGDADVERSLKQLVSLLHSVQEKDQRKALQSVVEFLRDLPVEKLPLRRGQASVLSLMTNELARNTEIKGEGDTTRAVIDVARVSVAIAERLNEVPGREPIRPRFHLAIGAGAMWVGCAPGTERGAGEGTGADKDCRNTGADKPRLGVDWFDDDLGPSLRSARGYFAEQIGGGIEFGRRSSPVQGYVVGYGSGLLYRVVFNTQESDGFMFGAAAGISIGGFVDVGAQAGVLLVPPPPGAEGLEARAVGMPFFGVGVTLPLADYIEELARGISRGTGNRSKQGG